MNIVEHLRKIALEDIFKTPTFQKCWAVWKPNINEILGKNWNETDLLNLGDSLSDIFKGTRVRGGVLFKLCPDLTLRRAKPLNQVLYAPQI